VGANYADFVYSTVRLTRSQIQNHNINLSVDTMWGSYGKILE